MKDAFKPYDVTCYVTVAVTVKGVRAASPAHAAMSAGTALAEELDFFLVGDLMKADSLEVDGCDREITIESDGSDIDGFLVQTCDGKEAVRLDKNGEPNVRRIP